MSNSQQTHQKHAKLARPDYGEFHRQEWAIIGTSSERIQALSAKLIAALQTHYQLAYVDTDHTAVNDAAQMPVPGNTVICTDQMNDQPSRYSFKNNTPSDAPINQRSKTYFFTIPSLTPGLTTFHRRPLFQQADGVLVNGNHLRAKRQVVILDPKKKESLSHKLDCLTDLALILTTEAVTKPYDFLTAYLGEKRPFMMPLDDINGIIQWLRAQLTAARAPLYGLVLAGGKSQRMGEDKGLINYHGVPQRTFLAQQLDGICTHVFYALRPDQEPPPNGKVISDSISGLGPFGAIVSAFREHPNAAWLVVACDLPMLDEKGLRSLVRKRNPSKVATTFYNPATGWPDPLLTIWEPRAYPVLLQFLAQGYSCPRKVLINSPVEVIEAENPQILLNANSPTEREQVLQALKAKNGH